MNKCTGGKGSRQKYRDELAKDLCEVTSLVMMMMVMMMMMIYSLQY
jgi:hypothetical protein